MLRTQQWPIRVTQSVLHRSCEQLKEPEIKKVVDKTVKSLEVKLRGRPQAHPARRERTIALNARGPRPEDFHGPLIWTSPGLQVTLTLWHRGAAAVLYSAYAYRAQLCAALMISAGEGLISNQDSKSRGPSRLISPRSDLFRHHENVTRSASNNCPLRSYIKWKPVPRLRHGASSDQILDCGPSVPKSCAPSCSPGPRLRRSAAGATGAP